MPLPEVFCWTRFGTEAGQPIDEILDRKEQERAANSGMFFWGIGNSIGPSLRELLRCTPSPEVLFSPTRSTPRREDVAPPAVVAWTSAETLGGDLFPLPDCSLVTSRQDPAAPKQSHYALVCFCQEPLAVSRSEEKILFAGLRNIVTNRPVGASQVTAVVRSNGISLPATATYDIAIRTRLVYPYLLRLRDPVLLNGSQGKDWAATVRETWERRRSSHLQPSSPRTL